MKKIGILIRKEMLDILRDKKTLIMMILVPIVLYPLLIIGMTLVLNSVMSTSEEVSYTVGFEGEYADVVADLQEVMAQDPEEFDEDVDFLAMDEGGSSAVLDATLRFETESDGRLRAEITYDSTAMNSAHVCRMLEDAVNCVCEDRPVPVTGEDGKRASMVALAAIASAREGQPVIL